MTRTPNPLLPVKIEPAQPPALWHHAAPMVVRGAALVAAGILGEWALRSAAKRAVSLPFGGKKTRAVAKRAPGRVSYSETIIVQRTVVRDE